MPVDAGNPQNVMYWALQLPAVSLVTVSTESQYDTPYVGAPQAAWVADKLKAGRADRTRPWLVAAGHRPNYCSNSQNNCRSFAEYLRKTLEPMYLESEVDVVFGAHEHDMEVSWPLADGKVVSKNYTEPHAPVYVLSGAGGSREGHEGIHTPQPWSAWQDTSHFAFARLTIDARTFQMDVMSAADPTGAPLHSVTLTK